MAAQNRIIAASFMEVATTTKQKIIASITTVTPINVIQLRHLPSAQLAHGVPRVGHGALPNLRNVHQVDGRVRGGEEATIIMLTGYGMVGEVTCGGQTMPGRVMDGMESQSCQRRRQQQIRQHLVQQMPRRQALQQLHLHQAHRRLCQLLHHRLLRLHQHQAQVHRLCCLLLHHRLLRLHQLHRLLPPACRLNQA